MLDLDTCVHFHEIKTTLLIQQKFDGADPFIIDALGGLDRHLPHLPAQFFIKDRRWGLLQQFLVTALDAAIAFAQMDRVSLAVADDLELDVPRILDIFLDIDRVVAEIRLGLALRDGQRTDERHVVMTNPHAFASASGRGLDDDRIFDGLGNGDRLLFGGDDPFTSRR